MVGGTPPPDSSLPLGSLQLVNHSCSPNCQTEHIETKSTLELVVLRSLGNVDVGKAREGVKAAFKTFTNAIDDRHLQKWGQFWRPARMLEQRPRGVRVKPVRCACAVPCPNDYARFERAAPSRPGTIRSARALLTEQGAQARSTSATENRRRYRARGLELRLRSLRPRGHWVLGNLQKSAWCAALRNSRVRGGLIAHHQGTGWARTALATSRCCLEGR